MYTLILVFNMYVYINKVMIFVDDFLQNLDVGNLHFINISQIYLIVNNYKDFCINYFLKSRGYIIF